MITFSSNRKLRTVQMSDSGLKYIIAGSMINCKFDIIFGKDQVTLFTCTPYGVNSHRLLVRGTRVPYNGEEEVTGSVADTMLHAIQNYYMLYLLLGIEITVLIIVIMKVASGRKQRNT